MPKDYSTEFYAACPKWLKLSMLIPGLYVPFGGATFLFGPPGLRGLTGMLLLLAISLAAFGLVVAGMLVGYLPGKSMVSRKNEPFRFKLTIAAFSLFAAGALALFCMSLGGLLHA